MSSFRVDLSESEPSKPLSEERWPRNPSVFDTQPAAQKRRYAKPLKIAAIALAAVVLIGAFGGYLYWQSVKGTPQYSLALLVDAAKHDDQTAIDQLVDVDSVVDDFLPQITKKAVELYGRGLPSKVVESVAQLSLPIVPAIKDRARAELPRVIRERSERFGNVPFAAMVLGAGRYLDISVTGDIAQIKSKIPDRPLEVKMRRNGTRWRIVGVKDEPLATQIAQKIGQEIIAIASNGGINDAGEKLGVKNLTGLLRKAEEILNK